MIKSAELPRVYALYKAKSSDYDAVCLLRNGGRGYYSVFSVKRVDGCDHYVPVTKRMCLRAAREKLTELAFLKADIVGNQHLVEYFIKR